MGGGGEGGLLMISLPCKYNGEDLENTDGYIFWRGKDNAVGHS